MELELLRDVLYADVIDEQYRIKMTHWLYRYHVAESISKLQPYVTKYAFYNALPTPPEGERFGTNRIQLTEHYWLCNPLTVDFAVNTYAETFPPQILQWQGNIPMDVKGTNIDGDDARSAGGETEKPFVNAFVPISWEQDLKGKEITPEDGPNYRWQFLVRYPDGVSKEDGDQWLFDEVLSKWVADDNVRRVLTSKVKQEINDCKFSRLVEVWFEGPNQWYETVVEKSKDITKPVWATTDKFPYLKPFSQFTGIFVSDMVSSDNFTQYHGYMTLR